MAFGMGELRLPPAAFWTMTPRELAVLARSRVGGAASPPSRHELQDLMQRYPDKE
jgi:uncharacterized phage protein (TIGR02216 family)